MSHFVLQRLIWGPARSCLGGCNNRSSGQPRIISPNSCFSAFRVLELALRVPILYFCPRRPFPLHVGKCPRLACAADELGRTGRISSIWPSLALAPDSARVDGVRALETLPYDEVRHGWMLNCSCAASVVVPSSFCSTLATVVWRWALGSLPPALMRAEGVRSFLVTLNIGQVGSTPSAVHANVALSTTRTRTSQRPGVYDPCTSQLSRHV